MNTSTKPSTFVDQVEEQKKNETVIYNLLKTQSQDLADLVFEVIREKVNPMLLRSVVKALLNITRTTDSGNVSFYLDNNMVSQIQGKHEYQCNQNVLFDQQETLKEAQHV